VKKDYVLNLTTSDLINFLLVLVELIKMENAHRNWQA